MANNSLQKTPAKQISVSSLLSPPEMKRSESFGSSATPSIANTSFSSFATMGSQSQYTKFTQIPQHYSAPSYALASPPISPYESAVQQENQDQEEKMDEDVRDPPLFRPSETGSSVGADEPLFPQEQARSVSQDAITRHMESPEYAQLADGPTREEYELAVTLVSNVYEHYRKNPRAWFLQERNFDRQISQQKRAATDNKEALRQKFLAPAPSSRSQAKAPKVGIPRLPRSPRVHRVQKPSPRPRVHDSFSYPEAGPNSASKAARPASGRDDVDYNSLPDYSPPLSTLNGANSNALKTEWKGSALKLTDDPDRHLLHEAEIPLAGTLRLTCATYLCSKRRIFQARIEALKIKKEFRKTDAQQACKIDVNKASKLWSVYDKVGWFDPKYFVNYV